MLHLDTAAEGTAETTGWRLAQHAAFHHHPGSLPMQEEDEGDEDVVDQEHEAALMRAGMLQQWARQQQQQGGGAHAMGFRPDSSSPPAGTGGLPPPAPSRGRPQLPSTWPPEASAADAMQAQQQDAAMAAAGGGKRASGTRGASPLRGPPMGSAMNSAVLKMRSAQQQQQPSPAATAAYQDDSVPAADNAKRQAAMQQQQLADAGSPSLAAEAAAGTAAPSRSPPTLPAAKGQQQQPQPPPVPPQQSWTKAASPPSRLSPPPSIPSHLQPPEPAQQAGEPPRGRANHGGASTGGAHAASPSLGSYPSQALASFSSQPVASYPSTRDQPPGGPWAPQHSPLGAALSQGPWSGFAAMAAAQAAAAAPAASGGTSPQPRAATSTMVCMARSDAWARFQAYEGCTQICIALRDDPESQHFLADGMKVLRDGFGIGVLLLSPDEQEEEAPVAESVAAADGIPRASNDKARSAWHRAVAKTIASNLFTKPARPARRQQVHKNDICWDDTEPGEEPRNLGPPLPGPPGRPTNTPPGGPAAGSSRALVEALPPPPPAPPPEPALRISVVRAKKSGTSLVGFGSSLGWLGGKNSGGGGRGGGNLQMRLSCGRDHLVSVAMEGNGAVGPDAASLLLPLGRAAAGGAGTGSGGGGVLNADLEAELVCQSGPLANCRIKVAALCAAVEHGSNGGGDAAGQGRRVSGAGAAAAAAASGGGGAAGEVKVHLFSNSDDRKVIGVLELAVQWVDPPRAAATAPPLVLGRAPDSPAGGRGGVPASPACDPRVAAAAAAPTARLPLRMSPCAAMDALMDAALRGAGCGRENLLIGQPWKWLVHHFAHRFNVTEAYTLIAHLRWILKPGVCSLTTHCLSTVKEGMQPLLQKERDWQLLPNEVNLLAQLKESVRQLLRSAFELYTNLSDAGDKGRLTFAEVGQLSYTELDPARISPLRAAFELFEVMRDNLPPSDSAWLLSCLRAAARLRWEALLQANSKQSGVHITTLLQGLSLNAGGPDVMPRQMGPGNARGAGGGSVGGGAPDVYGWGLDRRNSSRSVASAGAAYPYPRPSGSSQDILYKALEALSYAICRDVHYDRLLQSYPGLVPDIVTLAHATVEEYCGQFVLHLRQALAECPPEEHSPQAVNLLVAVAEMQRYLEEQHLLLDQRHPGYLSAMGLFRGHVLRWLKTSQESLFMVCQQLELQPEPHHRQLAPGSGGGGSAAAVASYLGLDHPPPPELFDCASVGPRLAALVTHMHSRCWGEMQGYARVMMHWARFGPDLEATVCRVLRAVLEALKRKYGPPPPPAAAGATLESLGSGGSSGEVAAVAGYPEELLQQAGGRPGGHHRRTQSEVVRGAAGAPNYPLPFHANKRYSTFYTVATPPGSPRSACDSHHTQYAAQGQQYNYQGQYAGGQYGGAGQQYGYGLPVPLLQEQGSGGSHGSGGQYYQGTGGSGSAAVGVAVQCGPPCLEVQHSEAVLLNSLKYFMVMVPTLECELERWCMEGLGARAADGGAGVPAATAAQLQLPDARSLIGHQFDQFVKELRTEYHVAVGACGTRLFRLLQDCPASHLQAALSQQSLLPPPPPLGAAGMTPYHGGGGAGGMADPTSATPLAQHVASLLAPLLAGLESALSALRASVEPRVYVAVGRALWDAAGRELYAFVDGLREAAAAGEQAGGEAGVEGAWRARQRAEQALQLLNGFFVQRLALQGDAEVQAQDLAPPSHVDMLMRLLQRSNASTNMAYVPF